MTLMSRAYNIPDSQTGAIIAAMLIYTARLPDAKVTRQPNINNQLNVTVKRNNRDFVVAGDAIGADDNEAEVGFLKKVLSAYENIDSITIDLCAAHQIKFLKESHIASFFLSKRMPPVNARLLLEYLEPISFLLPNIYNDPALKNKVSKSEWIKYRTSATSTGSLCAKAVDILGGKYAIFSQATLAAIENARDHPESLEAARAIPAKTVFFCSEILNQYNLRPDGWVQGKKAGEAINAAVFVKLRLLASKIKQIEMEGDDVNKLDTISDVNKFKDSKRNDIFD